MTDFTVTTLIDENDSGATVAIPGGTGLSLREALTLANADGDNDTITFAPSLSGGTIFLTQQAQLVVATTLTIDGDLDNDGAPDITVSADTFYGANDATNRVLLVDDDDSGTSITATLDGLVLRDGNAADPGGGIAVALGDALTLTNATVSGNSAIFGGGIFGDTNAAITLTDATVSGNSAGLNGGGIFGYTNVAITLTNATVSGNSAAGGGGIFGTNSAAITLTNATVSGNSAVFGGGIVGFSNAAITLTNATISGNSAGDDGGGIFGYHSALTLTNATVTGNSAGADGGGIYNFGISTVTTLTNSIVAGNAAGGAGDDLFGGSTLSDLVFTGGNIIGSAPANFTTPAGAPTAQIDGTNQVALETVFASVAPAPNSGVLSGVLAGNGGPGQTVALSRNPNNPALDGGDDSLASAPDARGFARHDVPGAAHNGANISDIGAFEQQADASFVVTTLDDELDSTSPNATLEDFGGADDLSLREALALANQDPTTADTITFAPSLSGGTIFLTQQAQLVVATTLTIDGDLDNDGRPDITVSADTFYGANDATNRVFEVFGEASATGITATLEGLVVRDGNDADGGGIFIAEHDALNLINSTVSDNTVTENGGGIYASAATTLVLTGATVSGNRADIGGGGIFGDDGSTIALTNSAILGNRAQLNGGGIYGAEGVPIAVTNSTFAGNATGGDGGAIYGYRGNTITVLNSTITGNSAGDTGGGIYNFGDGVTTLTNSIVAGNVASYDGNDLYGGGDESPSVLVFTGGNIIGSAPAGFQTPFSGDPTVTIDGASETSLATVFATVAEVDPDGDGGNEPFFAGVAADNGGPAWTVALNKDATNPALDGGDDSLSSATDARGFARHDVPGAANNGANISDVGAFEVQAIQSLVVTTLDDELDSTSPNATLEDFGGAEDLSLREALALANQDPTTADTITFAPSLSGGTIFLTRQAQLIVATTLTIDGDLDNDGAPDITVSADTLDGANDATNRVLLVDDDDPGTSITATLDGLVLRDGNAADLGGGIAVALGDALTLSNATVSGNSAGYFGGGIHGGQNAAITLSNATVSGNSAAVGGGIFGSAGAALTLTNATVSGNGANVDAGGIYGGENAAITLTNATVSGNSAGRDGGGIYGGENAAITLTNATLSGNSAGRDGGGIYGGENAAITLTNATVSGNSAGDDGGAIYGFADNAIRLTNSTVTGNSAGGDGGGTYNYGSAGVTTLANSIVAGNAAGGAGDDLFGGSTPSDLVFTGGNIIGSAPANFATPTGAPTAQIDGTNQVALETVFASVAPAPNSGVLSGVLADNGGPVQTVALSRNPNNPALDGGDDSLASATDARGFARHDVPGAAHNGTNISDVGAFEQQADASFVVTTLDDELDSSSPNATLEDFGGAEDLSLREALALANQDPTTADTITFAPSLSGGTIFLTQQAQLVVATTLTIDGDLDNDGRPDIAVSADTFYRANDATNRVLLVDDEDSGTSITATLDGLVLRDGYAADRGGGIAVALGDALTLINSRLTENDAVDGGGIYADLDATLTLTGATVSDNHALGGDGGGIFARGGSTVTLTNSTILRNLARDGGGISGQHDVAITATNSTFAENTAIDDGGAIYGATDNTITLVNTTVTGNSAGNGGGGIYSYSYGSDGVTTLTNSIVAGNAAVDEGNDLFGGGFDLTLTGSNIIGSAPVNFANQTGGYTFIDGESESGLRSIFATVAEVDPDRSIGGNDPFFAGIAADNGGLVPTVALSRNPNNPALDGGDDNFDPATDARGFARHDVPGAANNGANISDVGAFEQQADASFVVTTLHDELDSTSPNATLADFGGADDLSLREALALANQDPTTADTITFAAALTGGSNDGIDDGHLMLSQELGELVIAGDVTVDGDVNGNGAPDIIVDAQQADFEVFHAISGTSTLNGLVITGGDCVYGGGVLVGSYRGADSAADLTITNAEISGNAAIFGGGIAVPGGSSLTLVNSTVSDNTALEVGGGIVVTGTATIVNSTISGNTGGYAGGGIANQGTLTLTNTTIANNQAIYVEVGSDTLTAISAGGGYSYGGGLYNIGIATLNNSTVTGNSADFGGGIYTGVYCGCEPSELTLNNTIVAGNTAFEAGRDLHIGSSSEEPSAFAAAAAAPSVFYLGHNVFSQADVGRGEPDDFFEPNLANIFAAIDTTTGGGQLADNGGPVETVAILQDGVAHNAGDDETLVPDTQDLDHDADTGEDLPFDARGDGFVRVFGDHVDVGSFEINDGPPEGSTAGGSIQYIEDQAPTALDLALTVTDPGGLTSARIAITGNFAPDQDVLGFTPQSGITGSYNALTGVLTLTGNATDAQYQDALRSVVYSNTSQNPSEAARTVNFQVDDGGGLVSLGNVGVTVIAVLDPPDDTDGNHTTDIVWRNDLGTVDLWTMDGLAVLANQEIATIPNYWHIIDVDGDYDGDGNSDMLWQDDAGVVVLWTMDGPAILSNTMVSDAIASYWTIADTGDFTGDGRADILWRDDAGRVVLWEMDGPDILTNRLVADVPMTSQIEDTADFNGDGRNDILWRDDDGTLRIWEMDGANVVSDTTVGTVADTRHLAGTGDFNGDERFDILWRDDDGTVTLWEMDGANIVTETNLGTFRDYWQIADLGDYDGDLNSDILWRDTAGTLVLWQMDGGTILDNSAVNTIATHWHVVG